MSSSKSHIKKIQRHLDFKEKNYIRKKKSKPNKLEQRVYDVVSSLNLKFEREYQIPNTTKFYDIYLPDYNVLIEIDGSYWHKKDLTECKTRIQKRNFFNDIAKDKLAFKFGYRLIRILEKETDPEIVKILIKELNIKNTTNDLFEF
jgi:very-short-patch-repair endonuclease